MKKIKVDYAEFVKAIKEVKDCEQGWNVVIDLDDGEISVKHNSQTGINSLVLEHGYNIDSDFDDSDEYIDVTFGKEFIKEFIENATFGKIGIGVTK